MKVKLVVRGVPDDSNLFFPDGPSSRIKCWELHLLANSVLAIKKHI